MICHVLSLSKAVRQVDEEPAVIRAHSNKAIFCELLIKATAALPSWVQDLSPRETLYRRAFFCQFANRVCVTRSVLFNYPLMRSTRCIGHPSAARGGPADLWQISNVRSRTSQC